MRHILLFIIMAVLSIGFVVPGDVFAQDPPLDPPSNPNPVLDPPSNPDPACIDGKACLKNPLSNISSIPDFFLAIIDILMIFAVPFIVFFIIYAGFLYVTARGNAETIKKAHNALLYALIGGLLILGSRTLLTIITNTVTQIK